MPGFGWANKAHFEAAQSEITPSLAGMKAGYLWQQGLTGREILSLIWVGPWSGKEPLSDTGTSLAIFSLKKTRGTFIRSVRDCKIARSYKKRHFNNKLTLAMLICTLFLDKAPQTEPCSLTAACLITSQRGQSRWFKWPSAVQQQDSQHAPVIKWMKSRLLLTEMVWPKLGLLSKVTVCNGNYFIITAIITTTKLQEWFWRTGQVDCKHSFFIYKQIKISN